MMSMTSKPRLYTPASNGIYLRERERETRVNNATAKVPPLSTNDMQPSFTTPLLLADLLVELVSLMRAICIQRLTTQVYVCVQPIVNPCPLVSPFTVAIMHHHTRFRVRGITSHYGVFVVRGCCITSGTSANSPYAYKRGQFPRQLSSVLTFYRSSQVHLGLITHTKYCS